MFERDVKMGAQITGCEWKELLIAKYGPEYDAAYTEYFRTKKFSDLNQIVVEEEKIVDNFQVI